MYTTPDAQAAPGASDTSALVATTREPIERWMVDRLAECAGLDPQDIDLKLPCTAYGLDSLSGVTLVGDLECWLQRRLSPTLLWEMPSIDQLVRYLVEQCLAASEDESPVTEPDPTWRHAPRLDPETARQLLPHLDRLSDRDVEAMLYRLAA